MTRTDTHRPSVLDPAEYEQVGSFDAHHEDGYEEIAPGFEHHEYSGDHAYTGRCGHCGQAIRYGVIFHHEPSDTLIAVGLTCAGTLGLKSLSEKEIKAKAEYHRILKAIERFKQERPENAEVAAYFEAREQAQAAYHEALGEWNEQGGIGSAPRPTVRHNDFLSDVARKLRRYGSLSEAQVNAVLKIKARNAEFDAKREAEAAKLAEVAPLAEGRYEITGEVVSTKWVDNDFGGTLKMLVKMEDGNKVYGSVPSAINVERGDKVTFTAKVERSDNDEHFGFFSRPTRAEVIS